MPAGQYRKDQHSSVQDMMNESFDNVNRLNMVEIAGTDGSGNVYPLPVGPKGIETTDRQTTNRYDIQAPVYYVGAASVGSADSDPVWEVKKYDLSTNPYIGVVARNIAWTARVGASYG